jgi:hypothetical protein
MVTDLRRLNSSRGTEQQRTAGVRAPARKAAGLDRIDQPITVSGVLANVPHALAAASATGKLLALLTDGTAELAAPGYTSMDHPGHTAISRRHARHRSCGLQNLTAATFTAPGIPMLAATCARAGTAGIFADADGTWHAAGPTLPAALAHQPVQVLRLTTTASSTIALLVAGTGADVGLFVAWSPDSGNHLDPVGPAPAERRSAELGVLRARQRGPR